MKSEGWRLLFFCSHQFNQTLFVSLSGTKKVICITNHFFAKSG